MKLDNMKKNGEKLNFISNLNENGVQQILNQRGQSAFQGLVEHEKRNKSLCIMISSVMILLFLFYKAEIFMHLIIAGVALLIYPWEIYKYRFLRKINIVDVSIASILKPYLKFKNYIKREIIVVSSSLFVLYSLFSYFELFLKWDIQNEDFMLKFVLSIFGMFLFVSFMILYYVFMYRLSFKNFEKTIKDIILQ